MPATVFFFYAWKSDISAVSILKWRLEFFLQSVSNVAWMTSQLDYSFGNWNYRKISWALNKSLRTHWSESCVSTGLKGWQNFRGRLEQVWGLFVFNKQLAYERSYWVGLSLHWIVRYSYAAAVIHINTAILFNPENVPCFWHVPAMQLDLHA